MIRAALASLPRSIPTRLAPHCLRIACPPRSLVAAALPQGCLYATSQLHSPPSRPPPRSTPVSRMATASAEPVGPLSASSAPSELVMVYVTVPSREVGRSIAEALVGEQMAACVNIIPILESIYRWEGKVQHDEELLLLIKSRRELLPALTARVKALHTYAECEVVAVPIVGGSASYMQWVLGSTSQPPSSQQVSPG